MLESRILLPEARMPLSNPSLFKLCTRERRRWRAVFGYSVFPEHVNGMRLCMPHTVLRTETVSFDAQAIMSALE